MVKKSHYTWIKNINRLLYDQSKHKDRKYFCERCLHCYSREDLLVAHKPECRGIGKRAISIEMPTKGSKIIFQNWCKQISVPYVIYADFEALTTKIDVPTKSNTQKTELHKACGFSYIVVRCDGKTEPPVVYRGPDSVEKFLIELQKEEEKIQIILKNPVKIQMDLESRQKHNWATNCHVCDKPLFGDSVRDHCHITGKYRGAAHNECNLKLRLAMDIPIIFHNLRGYDSHLIMQAISKVGGDINCIPNNMEKYISFSLGKLRFIDSMQFLHESLDKLVAASKEFHITEEYEPNQKLLLRKGVYPYDYMDNWDRFTEKLPPQDAFYNKLSDESISDDDYKHAQQVWDTFNCKDMGDYHDLYLRTDVLLLADVFETFRKTCLQNYKLDPAHYYTSPGLSWDALLKKTGIELELLTDYDMHMFIEKGLRGGISMVSKRYAKANNPGVEGYIPDEPQSHILYLDANNLYGWAMSQPLPTGNFEWVENIKNDGKGYIVEVDLEYPKDLHNLHNAYPLAPEHIAIGTKVKKLVPNLKNKEKYVLHYRNLNLYMSLGMKLKKIHRVLRFDERPWMEPYIRMNTELRKKATSTFEKNLYKLMNNSVFGKTMENVRMRVDVKLIRSSEEDRLRKNIASPRYARSVIFDNDLVAVHMHKAKLKLNRPVYVGMSILDLSKHLMYDFYYNKLKCCELLYTDTDSLILEIKTDNIHKYMDSDLYDTSNYPKDHPLYSDINKKVLGKMKDECSGVPIIEFVGLRPKMYSILTNVDEIRKAKGVRHHVTKTLRHQQYKEVLDERKTLRHSMNMLSSERHQIYAVTVNKTSLSPNDTKRKIMEDGIHTLAYGHKDILL